MPEHLPAGEFCSRQSPTIAKTNRGSVDVEVAPPEPKLAPPDISEGGGALTCSCSRSGSAGGLVSDPWLVSAWVGESPRAVPPHPSPRQAATGGRPSDNADWHTLALRRPIRVAELQIIRTRCR